MKNALSAIALVLLSTTATNAQDSPKLSVTPTGRILVDGALYSPNKDGFNDGVAIPDIRIGVKGSYGIWSGKIDVGLAYNKVGFKDVFIQAQVDPVNAIKVGYFVDQFGISSATGSSNKEDMEDMTSNDFFGNPRFPGISWLHVKPKYFSAISVHLENKAFSMNSSAMGKQGWGAMTRQLYRPRTEPGRVFQIGISGAYASPEYNEDAEYSHSSYTMSAKFPTRVASVVAVEAFVPHAKSLLKFTPEIVMAHDRLALETQYFFARINRKDGYRHYMAQGAYVMLRGLLISQSPFLYSSNDGGLSAPGPKSLELTVAYNYTDASDSRAGIRGGILQDASATLTYTFNKYLLARLRYSYTTVRDRYDGSMHVNELVARIQFLF